LLITLNAYGGGDAFLAGFTNTYAGGVTGSGDEGQFVQR